jgi:membrane-bound lytic murein transglycosylase MltF
MSNVMKSFLVALFCAAFSFPAQAEPTEKPLKLPRHQTAAGDLDAMLARRTLRILVPFSKTLFFYDKAKSYGLAAELGRQLQATLNKKYGDKIFRIKVAFVPTARDRLLPDLVAGRGDIAVGGLTVTKEREQQVDFVHPWMSDVKEIVVTGPAAPPLASLDDLAGKEILVRKSSSYYTHLLALNEQLTARKLAPVVIKPAAEDLEDEDLMEMTNAGLLPFVVVDAFEAQIWTKVFDKLAMHPELAINSGGSIAWAIRKDSPKLRAELDSFVAANGLGTVFGNTLKRRYFTDDKILKTAYAPQDAARFEELVSIFKRYGDEYGFDYIMMGAQGYQESQLDQTRRSPRGAVGVMQLLPRVAAAKEIEIPGIDKDADANIHAGVKYMHYLADTYVNDPALDRKNRILMTFAAYNAGPGNLRKFRRMTTESGLDPNIWFGNVENSAAKAVGRETVDYVGNIYKYYVAYSLLADRRAAAQATREKTEKALGGAGPKP